MTSIKTVPTRLLGAFKRAFGQFLLVPLAVTIGFIALTGIIYWADLSWSYGHTPAGFSWLGKLLGDSTSLATLLATIASSIITVTSITFSLLLIAIQQGSSSLTAQVIDQFLMRVSNQVYLGYFIGLSVFVLLSLVTASSIHRPVFGATLIVILTIVALGLIVVLIYNTIDQMRPAQIVRAIHRHILKARDREVAVLSVTRRLPRVEWPVVETLSSIDAGHIVAIDVVGLGRRIAAAACGEVEVQLHVPIGQYLAFGDPMATLRAPAGTTIGAEARRQVATAVRDSVTFDDARDLRKDPSYGISQLKVIAWTSISTAKSNPAPALAVIQSLRDILARWSQGDGEIAGDPAALVVVGDAAPTETMEALEDIILVASESIQAQSLAAALRTVAILLPTAPLAWQASLADIARRALSSLGEHVLTSDLEHALAELAAALDATGFGGIGTRVRAATATLAQSLGVLSSRSTRVPTAST